jgi:hypothetical protein
MIAIIDADELCYKVGFGCQHTYYNVFDPNNVHVTRFTNAADCKSWIDGEEGYNIEKEVSVLPESVAIRNTRSTIRDLLLKVGTNQAIFCLSSPNNLRNNYATIQGYKGNRSPDAKPINYPVIKDYIINNFSYNVEDGYEADDLLAIYYNDIDPFHDKKAIIVTQDKDLLQVPAYFLSMGTEKHREYAEKDEVFYIDWITGATNFYGQLIAGDSTDNIPGIYQITGSKNSKKYLEELNSMAKYAKENFWHSSQLNLELYAFVRDLYYDALGIMDYDDLDCILWEIGNLLYIRRSFNDGGWEIPA